MRDSYLFFVFFFFNDTATTEIYTLSLHDALPICSASLHNQYRGGWGGLIGWAARRRSRMRICRDVNGTDRPEVRRYLGWGRCTDPACGRPGGCYQAGGP